MFIDIVIKIKKIKKLINFADITSRAAEISFFITLSLFPVIMFIICAISYIPGIDIPGMFSDLKPLLPLKTYEILYYFINSAITGQSIQVMVISFFIASWSFSKAIKSMFKGINRAYNLKETRSFFKLTFLSIVFAILFMFMICFSIGIFIFGKTIMEFLFIFFNLDHFFIYIWNIIRYLFGILVVIFIFTSFLKFSPNKKTTYKEASIGAIISTFLWILVSFIFSFYSDHLARSRIEIYGSITSIIVLMTWIYLSSYTIVIGYIINSTIYKLINKKNCKLK